jgi:His Kinase A (phospho-acceptor) domain
LGKRFHRFTAPDSYISMILDAESEGLMRLETITLQAIPVANWLCLFVATWLAAVSSVLWYRTRAHGLERRRERLLREELETYARLDATLPPGGDAQALAKRLCRMVSEKSAFRKSALLLRDSEGKLYVAGSSGMDDLSVNALAAWGARVPDPEWPAQTNPSRPPGSPERRRSGARLGPKSFIFDLAPHEELPAAPARRTLADLRGRAIILPLRTSAGYMAGALAVSIAAEIPPWTPTLEEAVPPLETLAVKLARTMENAALTERLVRMERLAALGQLTTRIAHELNNPLTSVLGFAELIVATSTEPRAREDAHTIVTQALRMREIIENLIRPELVSEESGASSIVARETV